MTSTYHDNKILVQTNKRCFTSVITVQNHATIWLPSHLDHDYPPQMIPNLQWFNL